MVRPVVFAMAHHHRGAGADLLPGAGRGPDLRPDGLHLRLRPRSGRWSRRWWSCRRSSGCSSAGRFRTAEPRLAGGRAVGATSSCWPGCDAIRWLLAAAAAAAVVALGWYRLGDRHGVSPRAQRGGLLRDVDLPLDHLARRDAAAGGDHAGGDPPHARGARRDVARGPSRERHAGRRAEQRRVLHRAQARAGVEARGGRGRPSRPNSAAASR